MYCTKEIEQLLLYNRYNGEHANVGNNFFLIGGGVLNQQKCFCSNYYDWKSNNGSCFTYVYIRSVYQIKFE